jgi:hypothetical protein
MDTSTLLLSLLAAALAGATFQAWRLGNERRDVALLGTFGSLLGLGAAATMVL